MTEQQLRDVLARVVPEPPDSVADATPVVRVARRRRQVRVAGVGALAAVLVAGTVLGVRAVGSDDSGLVADDPTPQIADPYTTAPCPSPTEPWENATVGDLGQVTAARYCTRPSDVTTIVGPADALVVDLDAFAEAVRAVPDADPARCAAVSVVPTDNRVLLQLGDGATIGLATGLCDDVEVEGRTVAGTDVVTALVAGLRTQRADHDYETSSLGAPDASWCGQYSVVSPALPSSEHLVAATYCGPNSPTRGGAVLDDATVEKIDDAWRAAGPPDPDVDFECNEFGGTGTFVLARTDRGDVVELRDRGCDRLTYSPFSNEAVSDGSLSLDVGVDDLG